LNIWIREHQQILKPAEYGRMSRLKEVFEHNRQKKFGHEKSRD